MTLFIDETIFEKQEFGGISRYFCELSNTINEVSSLKIIIYAGWSKNSYLPQLANKEGIQIIYPGAKWRWLKFAKSWINPILRKIAFLTQRIQQPEVVYHPSYFSIDRIIHKLSANTVLTVHDLIYEQQIKNKHSKKVTQRKQLQNLADHIIVVSESTARDLSKFNPSIAHKINVIHLAANLPQSLEPADTERNNTFLFIGKRKGYKNGMLAIEALSLLQKQIQPNANILFVGGGALNHNENEQIKKLGLEAHIRQANLTDSELSQAYQTSRALLFPSSYEGFGLPPLEAMQHNCPVIAQHVSSIPEVLGEWGDYLPSPTAMGLCKHMEAQLLAEDAKTASKQQNLRTKQLSKFSWQQTASKTISVYEQSFGKK